MEETIAELRRQLEEQQKLRDEERQTREEAERHEKEERQARKEAERRQEEAEQRLLPNTLFRLLDRCHYSLSQAMRVETDATLHFVVKFGLGVNLIEGENMLFIQEHTNVPVPRVYALYSSLQTRKKYIVMERITGQILLSIWPNLAPSEKEVVVTALRKYFNELRRLPAPKYYGSVGERYLLDELLWTSDAEPTINGPFASYEMIIEAMVRKYTYDGGSPYRADFYRRYLPCVLCNGRDPIFTHGDVQRKNIMIRKERGNSATGNHPQPQIVILDWEKSGWYPSYWDYCLGICALRWDDDWALWIEKVLDPYITEAPWLQSIRLEL